ncbi:MAG: hypothetical protein FMNOHCHN_00001 [Ignavibacteriaceae bacterium]|nr:hypothetical protein [Ignavibacteriaceae bacterium]
MQLQFRNRELSFLDGVSRESLSGGRLVLLTGKRDSGKTYLAGQHLKKNRGAYISLAIKSAPTQLADISEYLKSFPFTRDFIPAFRSWREFFLFLFHISRDEKVNLVIDDFHNFEKTDPEFLTEFASLWKQYARESRLQLILITGNQSFLRKYFGEEGLLKGLVDYSVRLRPVSFTEILKIVSDSGKHVAFNELVKIYLIFGGMPKYYAMINRFGLWGKSTEEILRTLIFSDYAPLGHQILSGTGEEFTSRNKIYLSVLQAIAAGKNAVTEIGEHAGIPDTSTTKYLNELEYKRGYIKRKVPLGTADPLRSKTGRYFFRSYFDQFVFRFIQPDIISYQMGQYEKMLARVMTGLDQYIREQFFLIIKRALRDYREHKAVTALTGSAGALAGEYWTRKVQFDLGILERNSATMKLCRCYYGEMPDAEAIKQLRHDFEEAVKQSPQMKHELLIHTEKKPARELIEQLPSGTMVYTTAELRGLLERLASDEAPKPEQNEQSGAVKTLRRKKAIKV